MIKAIATVKYVDMNFFWITDHYDIHLTGYCHYKGALCRFDVTDDFFAKPTNQVSYNIFSMTLFEKIKMLIDKTLFETCVGTSWSFPVKKESKKPKWLKKLLHEFYFWIK